MTHTLDDHYTLLGCSRQASQQEIKQAFRRRARGLHPDKGGDAAEFAALQAAAAVLLDPAQRSVYDLVSSSPGHPAPQRLHAQQPEPDADRPLARPVSLEDVWQDSDEQPDLDQGRPATRDQPNTGVKEGWLEGALLDLLASHGVSCDAATQLVVTCEMCSRPATNTCWVCECQLCELCTRTMHWKGSWGWHWPIVNSPGSVAERLGQMGFEAKRIEDAQEFERRQPGYVPQEQRVIARQFRAAAAHVASLPGYSKGDVYHEELCRYYLWTQTPGGLYLAVHLPEGTPEQEPEVTLQAGLLSVRCTPCDVTGSSGLPVVHRQLAGLLDTSLPMEITRLHSNRCVVLALAKAETGRVWDSIFKGDGQGVRRVAGSPQEQLYQVHQDNDEVVLEVKLPWWARPTDVQCDTSETGMHIHVTGLLELRRTFWTPSKADVKQQPIALIVPSLSAWSLSQDTESKERKADSLPCTPAHTPAAARAHQPGKLLTVQLAKRPLSPEEQLYKHGVRQDNLVATRADGNLGPAALFVEDEDEWGLTSLLQACVFQAAGQVFIAPRPWETASGISKGRWVTRVEDLPPDVRRLLRTTADHK